MGVAVPSNRVWNLLVTVQVDCLYEHVVLGLQTLNLAKELLIAILGDLAENPGVVSQVQVLSDIIFEPFNTL